jgi:hypothetical protein
MTRPKEYLIFRPFKDFSRISILNTWLVIVTFIYILPRDLIRKLRKKGFKRFIMEDFFGESGFPKKEGTFDRARDIYRIIPFLGFSYHNCNLSCHTP